MVSIGVIGSGAWGTALAILLSNEGIAATLWEHRLDAVLVSNKASGHT